MQPEVFLKGQKSNLRAVTKKDYTETMVPWLSDRAVTKYLVRGTYPSHPHELETQFHQMSGNRDEIQFSISEQNAFAAIGICGLHRIDWIARHAEFRILIGDKTAWNKGIGTEVNLLLLIYGFEILNFEKIWLGVNAANISAHKSYIKAGFKEEGRLRNEVYRAGSYFDVVRMSLLKSEYLALKKSNPVLSDLLKQIQIGSDHE